MIAVKARPADLDIVRAVLARQPKVKRAWVYGSRARGDAAAGADLDLAVEAPSLEAAELARLRAQLEESALILHLDLLRLDDLPPDSTLRRNIAAEGRLVYES